MPLHLLATRILTAAQAILGPMPRPDRAALLGEMEFFAGCSGTELEELARHI